MSFYSRGESCSFSPCHGEHGCLAVIVTPCMCHPEAASGQGETFTPLPSLGPIEASLEKVGGKSAALTERPLPGTGRHRRRHRWHGAEAPRAWPPPSRCRTISQQDYQCLSESTAHENRKCWDKILHLPLIVIVQLFSARRRHPAASPTFLSAMAVPGAHPHHGGQGAGTFL